MNPYVIFKYMYWRNNSIFTLCTKKYPPIGQRVVNYAVPKAKFCMETYSIDMHVSSVKVSTYYITQKIMASQPWTWSWKWNDHVIAFMGPWNCWKAREGGTARRKMVMVWSGVLHWIIRFGFEVYYFIEVHYMWNTWHTCGVRGLPFDNPRVLLKIYYFSFNAFD